MRDKMTLIVAKETENVLAVATRRGNPDSELAPEFLVGEGLEIRNEVDGAVRTTIAPSSLAVKTADAIEDLLLQPRIYALQDGLPVAGASASGITVNAEATGVTLTFGVAPAKKSKVWVQVEGGIPLLRHAQPGTVDVGDPSVKLNMTLQVGTTYQILALVEGYQAMVVADTP